MYSVQEIDVHQLKDLMEMQGELKLIDVRSHEEVANGAIPGADHVPLHLIPVHGEQIDEEAPVVFYCRSGARSAQACAYLSARGLSNVYNLRGGIMAWLTSGAQVA